MKVFWQRILQEIKKKNNTWNIRRLVDDSFVPSSKQPSVSYCKLTDFWLIYSGSPRILINYFSQWSTRHLKWACNLRACRAFFGLWKYRLQPILWFPVHFWMILIHNSFESFKYESQVLLTNLHVTKLWLSKLLKILFDMWSNLKNRSSMLVLCNLWIDRMN